MLHLRTQVEKLDLANLESERAAEILNSVCGDLELLCAGVREI